MDEIDDSGAPSGKNDIRGSPKQFIFADDIHQILADDFMGSEEISSDDSSSTNDSKPVKKQRKISEYGPRFGTNMYANLEGEFTVSDKEWNGLNPKTEFDQKAWRNLLRRNVQNLLQSRKEHCQLTCKLSGNPFNGGKLQKKMTAFYKCKQPLCKEFKCEIFLRKTPISVAVYSCKDYNHGHQRLEKDKQQTDSDSISQASDHSDLDMVTIGKTKNEHKLGDYTKYSNLEGTCTISSTEWAEVNSKSGFDRAKWRDLLKSKIKELLGREKGHFCTVACKSAGNPFKGGKLRKEMTAFYRCTHALCKEFSCKIYMHEKPITVAVYSCNEHNHEDHPRTEQIRGEARKALGKELLHLKTSRYNDERIVNLPDAYYMDRNMHQVQPDDVLNKVRSEYVSRNDHATDDLWDLIQYRRSEEKKVRPPEVYVQHISDPLQVHLYCQLQVEQIMHKTDRQALVVYFDATGTIVRPTPTDPKRVYCYSGICNIAGNLVPLCEFLSSQHDQGAISSFLIQFKYFVVAKMNRSWPIMGRVVSDCSFAIINAVMVGWNSITLKAYLTVVFKYAIGEWTSNNLGKLVLLHLCRNHFIKMVRDKLGKHTGNSRRKSIIMESMCALMVCRSLKEFDEKLADVFFVLLCPKDHDMIYSSLEAILSTSNDIDTMYDTTENLANLIDEHNFERKSFDALQGTPFQLHCQKIMDKVSIKIEEVMLNHEAAENTLYCPQFVKRFMKQYSILVPLWSEILVDCRGQKNVFVPSNASVESYFKNQEHTTLQYLTKNQRKPARVVREKKDYMFAKVRRIALSIITSSKADAATRNMTRYLEEMEASAKILRHQKTINKDKAIEQVKLMNTNNLCSLGKDGSDPDEPASLTDINQLNKLRNSLDQTTNHTKPRSKSFIGRVAALVSPSFSTKEQESDVSDSTLETDEQSDMSKKRKVKRSMSMPLAKRKKKQTISVSSDDRASGKFERSGSNETVDLDNTQQEEERWGKRGKKKKRSTYFVKKTIKTLLRVKDAQRNEESQEKPDDSYDIMSQHQNSYSPYNQEICEWKHMSRFTKEEQEYLNSVKDEEIMFLYTENNHPCAVSDVQRLVDDQKLTSSLIDVCAFALQHFNPRNSLYVATTSESKQIYSSKKPITNCLYEMKLTSYQDVVLFVNENNHWTMIVANLKQKTFCHLDPAMPEKGAEARKKADLLKQRFVDFLKKRNEYRKKRKYKDKDIVNDKSWRVIDTEVARQNDEVNCGLYVLHYLSCLLTGGLIENGFDVVEFRVTLVQLLIKLGQAIAEKVPEISVAGYLRLKNGLFPNPNYYARNTTNISYVVCKQSTKLKPVKKEEFCDLLNTENLACDIVDAALEAYLPRSKKRDFIAVRSCDVNTILFDHEKVLNNFSLNTVTLGSRTILMPYLGKDNHWCLITCNADRRWYCHIDPRNHKNNTRFFNEVTFYIDWQIAGGNGDLNNTKWEVHEVPQYQKMLENDNDDSGVFIILYSMYVMNIKSPTTDLDINRVRFEIATQLLASSSTMTHLCITCGYGEYYIDETVGFRVMVECSQCLRWSHVNECIPYCSDSLKEIMADDYAFTCFLCSDVTDKKAIVADIPHSPDHSRRKEAREQSAVLKNIPKEDNKALSKQGKASTGQKKTGANANRSRKKQKEIELPVKKTHHHKGRTIPVPVEEDESVDLEARFTRRLADTYERLSSKTYAEEEVEYMRSCGVLTPDIFDMPPMYDEYGEELLGRSVPVTEIEIIDDD